MLPPSPVSGPIGEDGFVFPLFELPHVFQITSPTIELVNEEEILSCQPDHVAADDNQCACQ